MDLNFFWSNLFVAKDKYGEVASSLISDFMEKMDENFFPL